MRAGCARIVDMSRRAAPAGLRARAQHEFFVAAGALVAAIVYASTPGAFDQTFFDGNVLAPAAVAGYVAGGMGVSRWAVAAVAGRRAIVSARVGLAGACAAQTPARIVIARGEDRARRRRASLHRVSMGMVLRAADREDRSMMTKTAVQIVVALFSSGGLIGGFVYALRFRPTSTRAGDDRGRAAGADGSASSGRRTEALERANTALERSTAELAEAREQLRKHGEEIERLRDRLTDAMASRQLLKRENEELREQLRKAEARIEGLELRVEALSATAQ